MARERLPQGLIQVYTGDGKGKTTSSFGLALRAIGQGLRVYMIHFMKGRDTGEAKAAARLAPDLTVRSFGRAAMVDLQSPAPEDLALAREGLEEARRVIASGEYDLVVLDEINVALTYRLIPPDEVLQLLRDRPPLLEVILTGRQAPPEIIAAADLVTEMLPIKHYYDKKIPARKGIEW